MPVKLFPHASLGAPLWLAAIAAFVIVAFMGSSDIAIAAKQPKCGDTITTDTTLHHNLVNCPNNGHHHRRRQRHPRPELPHDRRRR